MHLNCNCELPVCGRCTKIIRMCTGRRRSLVCIAVILICVAWVSCVGLCQSALNTAIQAAAGYCEKCQCSVHLEELELELKASKRTLRELRRQQQMHQNIDEKQPQGSVPTLETLREVSTEGVDLAPDPFGWNKPPSFQWKLQKWKQKKGDKPGKGEPKPAEQQLAFNALRAQRHAIIGPTVRKLAAGNANTVILLVVNSGQMPMFNNFLCSCEERELSLFKRTAFVFALDTDAKQLLDKNGVNSYHLDGINLKEAAYLFSNPQFKAAVFWKGAVTYDVLLLGVNVLFQDVDIVWRQSPMPYFLDPSRRHIDVFFMKDGNNAQQQPLFANSGCHFSRNNERTQLLWKDIYLNAHQARNDQSIVSPLLIHHYFVNSLRVYILPPIFTNGNYFGIQGPTRVPENAIVLHASWTNNITDKVNKWKHINEWYEPCVKDKMHGRPIILDGKPIFK